MYFETVTHLVHETYHRQPDVIVACLRAGEALYSCIISQGRQLYNYAKIITEIKSTILLLYTKNILTYKTNL
jgi:hypothetical protein